MQANESLPIHKANWKKIGIFNRGLDSIPTKFLSELPKGPSSNFCGRAIDLPTRSIPGRQPDRKGQNQWNHHHSGNSWKTETRLNQLPQNSLRKEWLDLVKSRHTRNKINLLEQHRETCRKRGTEMLEKTRGNGLNLSKMIRDRRWIRSAEPEKTSRTTYPILYWRWAFDVRNCQVGSMKNPKGSLVMKIRQWREAGLSSGIRGPQKKYSGNCL